MKVPGANVTAKLTSTNGQAAVKYRRKKQASAPTCHRAIVPGSKFPGMVSRLNHPEPHLFWTPAGRYSNLEEDSVIALVHFFESVLTQPTPLTLFSMGKYWLANTLSKS